MSWRAWLVITTCVTLACLPAFAQEEGAAAEESGPETVRGRNEAVGFLTPRGMVFELAQGARLEVPANLPVGASRRTVFKIVRQRPRNQDVAEGFRRFGEVLSFDAAIDATRAPVQVSVRARRSPARDGERLVLAMEQAAMCNAQNTERLGGSGLCSSWVLIDARHEGERIVAETTTPGGYRLVFGTVPVPPEPERAPSEGDPLGGL